MSIHNASTVSDSSNGTLHDARPVNSPGRYAHADPPEDVSDELAALFLGEVDASVKDEPGPEAPPTSAKQAPDRGDGDQERPLVSVLVLGNLPVFAGAWSSQYARDRQKASGQPLALLTLADESARLELFGPRQEALSSAPDIRQALRVAARMDAELVIRLPEAEAGWIGGESGVASITILTGADDPAIVGAYRSLKAIVQDLAPKKPAPTMRVAIAGCDERVADEAGRKLAQAAERFLGMQVELGSPVRQIDAGASAELYHGLPPAWADVPDLLRGFVEEERGAGEVRVRPGSGEAFQPRRHAPPVGFEAEGVSVDAARSIEKGDGPSAQHVRGPASVAPAGMPGKASGETWRGWPEGLRAVEVACPYAREVGIGVDQDGRLHAVAWATDAGATSTAVRDLVVASSWLRDHAGLVAVVLGRRLSDELSVRHLVLHEARGALALAQGDLRVHVAVPKAEAVIDLN